MKVDGFAPKVMIAPVAALDPYALRVEQIRGQISGLSSLEKGVKHSIPTLALLVTSTPPSSGRFEITATWTAPTSDPALGGALLYSALMAIKQQAPGVYAEMLQRLTVDGALTPA